VESGAICTLHTWGQNLSLHPHVHCIVPAVGYTLKGKMKRIGKKGKYLYPVHMLSDTFRGKLMERVKTHLKHIKLLQQYQELINKAYAMPWVVFCEPSFGSPEHIVKYLAQYTNRVAITNHRLLNVGASGVAFLYKDYRQNAMRKPTILTGVEFLRRFCMHFLPLRFVKVRHYGIYSSRFKSTIKRESPKMAIKPRETVQQRILRLTGFDVYLCPFCKKGHMATIEILPRVRSPSGFIYNYSSKVTV
jgi:tRNA(Leu) C34 or U34 (ribose-2'-O)-methylase TrmL